MLIALVLAIALMLGWSPGLTLIAAALALPVLDRRDSSLLGAVASWRLRP